MSKVFSIIVGVIFVLFGIYLWNNPGETIIAYSLYLGLFHLASSVATLVFYLVKKFRPIPYGNILLSFAIGFAIVAMPWLSLPIMLWIFVFSFLLAAIFYFVHVTKHKDNKWYIVQLIIASLGLVYAVVMLFSPVAALNTVAKILAATVIINGVSYIVPKGADSTQ